MHEGHPDDPPPGAAAGSTDPGEEAGREPSGASIPGRVGRRAFLRRLAAAGLTAGGVGVLGALLHDRGLDRRGGTGGRPGQVRDFRVPDDPALPQLALARRPTPAATPEEMVRAVVEGMGGMKRFVQKGETVVIKPNAGWDRDERHAANTNPVVVATLVRLCLEAGAARVIVSDVSCNDARRSFTRSGIGRAAQEAGALVVLPEPRLFRPTYVGGEVLDVWPVLAPFLDADRVINVPVVKHHGLTGATIAMKNLYGILGGRRNLLHQDVHASVVDLAAFLRPTLTVVDACRVLLRNGPQGGSYADVAEVGEVVATTDLVAGDAWGVRHLGRRPEEFEYIGLAGRRGLGVVDPARLRWKEVL